MNKKTRTAGTRLLQLTCLLVTLFLGLQVIPRAPAQQSAGSRDTIAAALQLPGVSPDTASIAAALPVAGCDGGPFWDQYNNPATEPPVGIGSQKFEPAMTAFDDQAADDFVISGGWGAAYITGVRVMGEYSAGGGPASSFNIYFYQNGAGTLPGTLIAAFMNLPYVETTPDFLICLPHPFASVQGYIGCQYRPGKIPIRMASGSGIIGLFNQTQVLPGRTRVTVTGPAASRGTERAPAWPIKYRPIRSFRFSGSVRGQRQRPNPCQHQGRAQHRYLAQVRDFHLVRDDL